MCGYGGSDDDNDSASGPEIIDPIQAGPEGRAERPEDQGGSEGAGGPEGR
jgi:hypothetical protein